MELFDTHCHIHEAARPMDGDDPTRALWAKLAARVDTAPEAILARAHEAGVTRLLCVGCTTADSGRAVQFAAKHQNVWASIGIHPHEAAAHLKDPALLAQFKELLASEPARANIVAVGECGLDYFYTHSPKRDQEKILRFQFELALAHDLPMVFHVREAFGDFWPIFDEYKGVRGVVHSFTATQKELDEALARGLYLALNGIMTFTKKQEQLDAAKAVPLNRLLLETDAPFLTPYPFRDTICEPKHTCVTAEFLAHLRGERLTDLAQTTTANARKLFGV